MACVVFVAAHNSGVVTCLNCLNPVPDMRARPRRMDICFQNRKSATRYLLNSSLLNLHAFFDVPGEISPFP